MTGKKISLILLAGGKSSRMGTDKARLEWHGKTLIEYTLAKAQEYGFAEIIVVTNSQDEYYQQLPVDKLVKDIYVQQGPLSGIHAGLMNSNCEYNFVLSCDMPLFDFKIVDELLLAIQPNDEVVIPEDSEHHQPLAALYTRECAAKIAELLEHNKRKISFLFKQVSTRFIAMHDRTAKFYNVNTPEEFANAAEMEQLK